MDAQRLELEEQNAKAWRDQQAQLQDGIATRVEKLKLASKAEETSLRAEVEAEKAAGVQAAEWHAKALDAQRLELEEKNANLQKAIAAGWENLQAEKEARVEKAKAEEARLQKAIAAGWENLKTEKEAGAATLKAEQEAGVERLKAAETKRDDTHRAELDAVKKAGEQNLHAEKEAGVEKANAEEARLEEALTKEQEAWAAKLKEMETRHDEAWKAEQTKRDDTHRAEQAQLHDGIATRVEKLKLASRAEETRFPLPPSLPPSPSPL